MKIVDIASSLYLELEQDEDISVASITNFLRNKIGDLNNKINQGFVINDSYEIIDSSGNEIDADAVSILKQIYLYYFYGKKSRKYLGAAGAEGVKSVQQDGITVVLIQKTDLAKQYSQMQKEIKDDIKQLVNGYKFNRSSPRHVESDDRLPRNPPLIVNPLNNASTYENY